MNSFFHLACDVSSPNIIYDDFKIQENFNYVLSLGTRKYIYYVSYMLIQVFLELILILVWENNHPYNVDPMFTFSYFYF